MGEAKHQPLTEGVFYILLSLYTPLHGYGIMQKTKAMTNGRVKIGAGTLYGAINSLLTKGFIEEYNSEPQKKEYVITEAGRLVVEAEVKRLRELVINGETVLKENGYEQS